MNLIIGKNYVAALMIYLSPALKIVVGSFYKRDTNIPLDFSLKHLSDYRTVGLSDRRTIGLSDYQTVGLSDCWIIATAPFITDLFHDYFSISLV
jgi:hypothetical protein